LLYAVIFAGFSPHLSVSIVIEKKPSEPTSPPMPNQVVPSVMNHLLGGAACLLSVSLLGTCAYNSLWSQENRWKSLHYGREATLGSVSLAISVLGAFAFLVQLCAFFLTVFTPKKRVVQLLTWTCALILTFVVIGLEGAGLEYTKYGNSRISTEWNYYSEDEFRTYADTYRGLSQWINYVTVPVPAIVNDNRGANEAPVPLNVDLPDYMQYYARSTFGSSYDQLSIAPVALNWTDLSAKGKLRGPNPCNYGISDSDAAATIGKWTAEKFKDYWCDEYTRQVIDFNKWKNEDNKDEVEIIKYNATYTRQRKAVGSLAGFYRHNTYLIYIQVAGFLCVAIALFFIYFYDALCGDIDDMEVSEAGLDA
jgi:hypothetical protein